MCLKAKWLPDPNPLGFIHPILIITLTPPLETNESKFHLGLKKHFDSILKQRIMSSLFNDLQNRGWKKLLLCFGYISFAILSLGMPSIEQKRNNNNLMIARTAEFWANSPKRLLLVLTGSQLYNLLLEWLRKPIVKA